MRKFFLYAFLPAILLCSATGAEAQDTLSQKRLDSIIVSTSRAGVNTPVANTTLGHNVVERVPSTYSLPLMLNMLPSVVATTEGGLALGYSNMRVRVKEKIEPDHLFLVDCAKQAMESLSITPKVQPIRGGTDGARLSYMGLPCPNLCAGGHNFHGRYEYVPVQSMERITALLVRIVERFPWGGD